MRDELTAKTALTLREVTSENLPSICELAVTEAQGAYVVASAIAVAEACEMQQDRLQAIYADDTPVGIAVVRTADIEPRCFLWRFMIDARYQGKNYGRRAIGLLVEQAGSIPANTAFYTSIVAGDQSPQGFYESLGFQLTGDDYEGEALMRLAL